MLGWKCSERGQRQTGKTIKKAEGIVGRKQESLHSAYHRLWTDRLNTILADETHPHRPEFDSRRIDRSGRFRVSKARTKRYKNSFIPSAIQTFNQLVKRELMFHLHPGCNLTTTICATVFIVCMCACVRMCGWGERVCVGGWVRVCLRVR